MDQDDEHEITDILSIWKESKEKALFDVFGFEKAYKDLQIIARKAKREMLKANYGDVKCTDGMIHDTFKRLSKIGDSNFHGFENRSKFYELCRKIMTGMLIDFLRKSSTKNEHSTDYQSEMIVERVKHLSLENFKSDFSYQELCILAEEVLSKIAKLSEKFEEAVEMFRQKIEFGLTNEEIAHDYRTNETEVARNITAVRAKLKCEIKYKSLIDRAVQITNTTQRNSFIQESFPDDKNLIKQIEVILKQIRNER